MFSLRASLPALRLVARSSTSLSPARSTLTASEPVAAGLVRRSFASTRPAFIAPPSRTHSGAEEEIRAKLIDRLEAEECDVEDTSGGCGTFYQIRVSSPAFIGLSTVKQHRLVNDVLKEEIRGIHGLQLKTSAPPKE